MTPNNIFMVFHTTFSPNNEIYHTLLGKFILEDGNFEILEDHGLPKNLETAKPADAADKIYRLANSQYFQVVNLYDLLKGHHPHLIESLGSNAEVPQGQDTTPEPSKFTYERLGGEGPRSLEISDGKVFLDGHLLDQDEINLIQENVKSTKAVLKKLVKHEHVIEDAVSDHHLNTDSSGLGNKHALKEFEQENKPGVYLRFDLNGLQDINSAHGHKIGDASIKAIGNSVKNVGRELVGKEFKAFRIGGSKFLAHVPTVEGAAIFARGLRQHLESIPAIQGTHSLSVTAGIGPSKDHAHVAFCNALAEHNKSGYKPGQSKTHIATYFPGSFEGEI